MKKLFLLMLCAVMLIANVSIAHAADAIYAKDTFDGFQAGEFSAYKWKQATNVMSKTAIYDEGAAMEIIEDGYNGNAVKITENGGDRGFQLCTAEYTATADEPVYISFRLKVLNNADGEAAFRIAVGYDDLTIIRTEEGRNRIWFHNNNKTDIEYELDKWYTFRYTMTPGHVEAEVEDEQGNIATGYKDTNNKFLNIRAGSYNQYAYGIVENSAIALDEITVIQGKNADKANFEFSNYGAVPVSYNKTVVAEEKFNDNTIYNLHYYMGTNPGNFGGAGLWAPDYLTFSMVSDCNGGYCPEITEVAGKDPWFATKSVAFDTGKAFVSFKYKPIKTGESGSGMGVIGFAQDSYDVRILDGKFETWNYWGRKTYTYTPDTWYTFVFEFETVNNVKQASVYIYDDQGKEVIYSGPTAGNSPVKPLDAGQIYFSSSYKQGQKYAIDDMLVVTTDTTDSKGFIESQILGKTADTTVYTTTPSVKTSFDNLIGSASTAKFVAEDESEIAAKILYAGASLVEIAPVTPLAYDTKYVLDLSGIKTVGGQSLSDASASKINLTTAPYSVGTLAVGTPTIDDNWDMSVDVTFTNEDVKELNTYLIAGLYDGNELKYVDVKNIKEGNMGQNTFTFKNVPDGASGMTLKIFAWDNFNCLKPLYK